MFATALAAVRAVLARLPGIGWLLALIPGAALAAEAAEGATAVAGVAKFFSTPIGKAVGAGLIGLTLYIAGDWHRARVDRAAEIAAVEANKQAAVARDAEIHRKAAAEAQASIATIQAEAERLKKQVADYETYIAAHGGDACRATPGASRRLRGL